MHVTASGALVAVASDGAGSAAMGGAGARLVCEALVETLDAALPGTIPMPCTPRSRVALRRAVRAGVEAARARAAAQATEAGLTIDACHATLVGAVAWPGLGGMFFHIGDGAALAVDAARTEWRLSAPVNGEFADTTYFFTEADWRRRLRIDWFGPEHDTILVMTDGVTELGLNATRDGAVPFMPFFEPICRYLDAHDRETGERALHATLDSEAVRARTGDDKTLLWARFAA